MTQLTLSKSTYLKEAKKLDNYQKFLPPLDLKRQQLILEKNKAKRELSMLTKELNELTDGSAEQLKMLADTEINAEGYVAVDKVELSEQNLLGVRLPVLGKVSFKSIDHGYLTTPHWVDVLVQKLQRNVELKLRIKVYEKRFQLLGEASRKATQRVNLVSKILIPEAQTNMRKISIFLSDNERAAVVRSKLAKKKNRALRGEF